MMTQLRRDFQGRDTIETYSEACANAIGEDIEYTDEPTTANDNKTLAEWATSSVSSSLERGFETARVGAGH